MQRWREKSPCCCRIGNATVDEHLAEQGREAGGGGQRLSSRHISIGYMPLGTHQGSLLLATFGKFRIVLQEAAFMSRITVLGHICREDRLAVLHVPGVFRHQMAGAALRGDRIGHTVIEGAYAREVRTRIQRHDGYDSSDNTPQ